MLDLEGGEGERGEKRGGEGRGRERGERERGGGKGRGKRGRGKREELIPLTEVRAHTHTHTHSTSSNLRGDIREVTNCMYGLRSGEVAHKGPVTPIILTQPI